MAFTAWKDPRTVTGDWTNKDNVKLSDNVFATAVSVAQTITLDTFGFAPILPASQYLLVDEIEVRIEAKVDDAFGSSGSMTLDVDLSPDAGSTWTSIVKDADWTEAEGEVTKVVSVLGTPGNRVVWGRFWSASELSDANFRVRVTLSATGGTFPTAFIDNVQCRHDTHVARYAGGGGDITNQNRIVTVSG
jgi:hypothetical protein